VDFAELGFYKLEFDEALLEKIKKLLAKMPYPVRWALSMLVGFTLLLIGLIMLVTPGPGLLFIFFGLSILALELEWAREINKQGLQGLEKIVAKLKVWFRIGKKDK
jgi:uncharacterized protein (TIGR02611 family)